MTTEATLQHFIQLKEIQKNNNNRLLQEDL